MSANLKRSNAPTFWLLFGAGGMLSALLGPVLVFITGIAIPLGLILSHDAMTYAHMKAFAHHWIGAGFIWVIISLFFWHAGHRIFHTLHDVGIHAGATARLVCYGIPFLATLFAASALVSILV